MSRRLNSAQQGAQQRNQQTLQSLLKLETNKICADCKNHKHPRWASWNLGVFICIRCSGIHRGMGTHISRVKSVDLDTWTDEQMQSILSWGNARANKYWEAKLAAGHIPSDGKVESFIRTKYELKRWVMDGPMPDPSTLDDNENMPLSLVKEKGTLDKKETIRKASVGQSSKPGSTPAATAAQGDLLGGQDPVPQRASTVSPPTGRVAAKGAPAPPKATNAKDSLLGLDFFGDQPAAPPRPSSTTGATSSAGSSRPDLKQSILSLYATAPRPQPQQPPAQQFGGMASPTYPPAQQSGGGLVDSFSGLSFGNAPATTTSPPPAMDPFAAFASPSSSAARPTSTTASFGGLGGGSFFDAKPTQPAPSKHQATPSSGGFAGLGSLASPTNKIPPSKPSQPSSAALGDLFDFGSPAPAPSAAPVMKPAPSQPSDSVFNLSAPAKTQPAEASVAAAAAPMGMASNNWANSDVWGGNAWSAPDPSASSTTTAMATAGAAAMSSDLGWGASSGGGGLTSASSFATQSIVPSASGGFGAAPAPQVSADEEFGGWTSSTGGGGGGGSSGAKPAGGFGASEDLFSNVWQ